MLARIPSRSLLALVLGAAAVVSSTAQARTWVGVSIGIAPPPPRVERVVVRPGYVWSPGYWRWTGVRHVWVGGYWVPARPGYRWVGSSWARWGEGWHFRPGHWVRYY